MCQYHFVLINSNLDPEQFVAYYNITYSINLAQIQEVTAAKSKAIDKFIARLSIQTFPSTLQSFNQHLNLHLNADVYTRICTHSVTVVDKAST